MGSNWKTARLLDQYEVRSGLSKPAKDFGTGYPFLTFKDVFYNYFTPEVLGDLVESTDKERDGCSVKRGDVFLTRTSETMNELGMSCVALKDYEGATFNGFCKRLRPNEQCELVPEYVGYYLRSPKFRQAMVAFSTMSTRASLNNEMIGRLEISYPPKEAQRHIAHVLKTLDNKITLNSQINQTLEQMAQTLFKSWFVDFDPVMDNALDAGFFEQDWPIPDELQHRAEVRKAVRESEGFKPLPDDVRQLFPDAFEESELGWVPKGWETKPISSLINLIGGGTPKTSEESYWGGEIPWFSVVDAPNDSNVFVLDTEKKVTEAGVANSSTKVLRVGTTIISARGTVGKCALVATPMAMNQSCYGVVGGEGVHDYFVYYLLKQSVKQLQQRSHGSVFSTITRDTFSSLKLATGNVSLTQLFGNTISPWFEKILANNQQQSSLERLRDTLLPKLISGELRLDEVELAVEQEAVSAEQQNER
ncbi:type I restriction modification DNA specificity domain protein [Vibrio cholerae]|nr:type I restriction modification DNA specificity domain protein [Vibrio cholerae]